MTEKLDYSKMTNEDFDGILEELVGKMSAAQILAYGDVNALLREELNNEVLAVWKERNKLDQKVAENSVVMDKEILINAIVGQGFKKMSYADAITERGLAEFSGNQWNPNWRWKRNKLQKLSISELNDLYLTGQDGE